MAVHVHPHRIHAGLAVHHGYVITRRICVGTLCIWCQTCSGGGLLYVYDTGPRHFGNIGKVSFQLYKSAFLPAAASYMSQTVSLR